MNIRHESQANKLTDVCGKRAFLLTYHLAHFTKMIGME